ncbi:DUF3280 domain-containing protein [Azospirillum sp. RWY-5-1]|uniref:DUF3280 domain-containing protein n=1 Tax=Azospirillum oleiclasticum TaxID=2735135 RepID=A0ABX2THD0_9PROT|nr:DUF3280 domain-containing protein [Azospirillum oleiclasticum]NYZ14493.1 DUF3280 domain-containing protein [Azospirillum oleiclasticum]NYZ23155.1 DUF3280 domain-containing protein [Azospirillum oleiclasticum]
MRMKLLLLLLAGLVGPARAEPAARVVVFDMEIADTSGEGAHPDHPARLRRMTDLLVEGLRATGRYQVQAARDSAIAAELPPSIRECNGCERELARRAGADIVVTGVIHKISTLILNERIMMRDVNSGEVLTSAIVDIRGDNERSWKHGVEWMLRHRLPAPVP